MTIRPLPVKQLYKESNLDFLNIQTTADLKPLNGPLGQERALSSIDFFINMQGEGYNLFCVGPEGTGKKSLTESILKAAAAKKKASSDYCYVNNFTEPHKPRAIEMPAGTAGEFAKDMEKFIGELQITVPAAFEGEEYRNRLRAIEAKYKDRKEDYLSDIQKKVKGKNVSILHMPMGLVVAPTKGGEVLSQEAFDRLPEKEKQEILAELGKTQESLAKIVKDIPKWEEEQNKQTEALNKKVVDYALRHSLEELVLKYKGIKGITSYLKDLNQDILENIHLFLKQMEEGTEGDVRLPPMIRKTSDDLFRRYRVNVFVKREKEVGAPVVTVDHPTFSNLFGRMEKSQQFGILSADFSLLRPGALHEANGGYLVIEAGAMLKENPSTWEALKRALKSKKIKMEAEEEGAVSTVTLNPEIIPLEIKVVLIGDTMSYYILSETDPDFKSLFKVEAHFDASIGYTNENIRNYCRLISSLQKDMGIKSLNKKALERVIEEASRKASDQEKLTTEISVIQNLLAEADYFADKAGTNIITAKHVDEALLQQRYRSDRIKEDAFEQIRRGLVMLSTKDDKVGQINALAVYEIGSLIFGKPTRITCQVRMGSGQIIDIEREIEMSGPSHSKGVMIISSFLASRFSMDAPLSLEASLVFEQSYSEVDGDSASMTELFALMSALANAPINQGIATTGSVNQFGEIQAIGGVNEKIEGFFEICKMQGLTGKQGVIIPKANAVNLMLPEEIRKAVDAGKFDVYAIETIDEGIEILTGQKVGTKDKNGKYPKDTINGKVAERLDFFLQQHMTYGSIKGKDKND